MCSPYKFSKMTAIPGVEEPVCRICHGSAALGALSSPCDCRGSLGYVHLSCLSQWVRESRNRHCEICNCDYRVFYIRRGITTSLRRWLERPSQESLIKNITVLAAMTPLQLWMNCAGSVAEAVLDSENDGQIVPWRLWVILIRAMTSLSRSIYWLWVTTLIHRHGLSPWRWLTWWRCDAELVEI
ncbi:E3 ubiquitin-protein ligase MARCHF2-like isoform X2 [Schistocerca gregaria]|uniref:E3 ubiquitin-protein ligase MARCHF2-like isoform X2 n=1 Tax=Schistocerca gregaria TaxID=7010 RepID=UPI00211E34CC|nr:E3 ubiquitin-protein ligase MARCHF2-like isoform X2 [Schistocerca gregaria]